MRAGQQSVAAAVLAISGLVQSSTAVVGQDPPSPRWVIAAGAGALFRTEYGSSFGGHLRASGAFQPTTSLFVEPGLTWHEYARSSQSFDVCPPGGCPPIRHDEISLLGLELGATYRRIGAANPIQPLMSIGVYRSSSLDTALTRFGATAGLVIPFRRSGFGPAFDVRYFRMFGDPRFKSLLPVSLRWSF